MSSKPWRDKQRLREEYLRNGKSSVELSREWGCSKKTVLNWLHRHNIQTRTENKHKPVPISTGDSGYERWYNQHEDDHYSLYVHRLLAVAEYGLSEVSGSVIHHENNIPWDNRPENIRVFESQSEHSSHHGEERELDAEPWRDEFVLKKLYLSQGKSTREISHILGCSKYTVRYWLDKHDIQKRSPNGVE